MYSTFGISQMPCAVAAQHRNQLPTSGGSPGPVPVVDLGGFWRRPDISSLQRAIKHTVIAGVLQFALHLQTCLPCAGTQETGKNQLRCLWSPLVATCPTSSLSPHAAHAVRGWQDMCTCPHLITVSALPALAHRYHKHDKVTLRGVQQPQTPHSIRHA